MEYKTVEQFVIDHLYNNGMSESQAEAVLVMVKRDPAASEMSDRWRDFIVDYPSSLQAAILMIVNRVALEWIDFNLPNAWYRPMFASKGEIA